MNPSVPNLITRRSSLIVTIVAALFGSFFAHGQAVDEVLAKVTIVVDGMMKSKSGAT